MPEKNIILFGCGSGLIVDFEELCYLQKIKIEAIVNNYPDDPPQALNLDRLILPTDLKTDAPFLCPLFTPMNRFKAVRQAIDLGLSPYVLLSHTANDLSTEFRHGVGCFINKRVVIGARSYIGDFVLINRGACLGHDVEIHDFVSIGPGATTGGNITIETGAMIGTGAILKPTITIGQNAIIGAGAVVTKDVEANTIVVGNPARKVGENPTPIRN